MFAQNHSIFSHVSLECSVLSFSSDSLFIKLFSDATISIIYTTDWNQSPWCGICGHLANPTPDTVCERVPVTLEVPLGAMGLATMFVARDSLCSCQFFTSGCYVRLVFLFLLGFVVGVSSSASVLVFRAKRR